MKNQIIKMTMMTIGAVVLMTAAVSAQSPDYPAKGSIYDGVESSSGNQDPLSGFQYGNTFVLTSIGKVESRYLTVSVNSQEMFKGVGVTGGAWSLAVFRDGAHVGTLYGDVVSGEIQQIIGKKVKQTRLELRATGGTGIFDNDGSLKINGSLFMTTDLSSKRTTAFETLNF